MKKRLLSSVFVIIFIAILSGCRSSREVLLENAAGGNGYHQGVLGECYLTGNMFQINYDLAAKWAGESAEKGNPVGQYTLGIIYQYGLGSAPVDKPRAEKLFKAAFPELENMLRISDDTNESNQLRYDLGTMYLYGRGSKKDYTKAYILLKKAAEKHYPPAMTALAKMYLHGYGVELDVDKAKSILLKAAMKGYPEAQVALADIYYTRKNYVAAVNWYRSAIKKNSPQAMTSMARMHRHGIGTAKDLELAVGELKHATSMNYPPALTDLADIVLEERVTAKEEKHAVKLYRQAIAKDYTRACLHLADYYATRINTNADYPLQAMVLYQLAANNGFKNLKNKLQSLDKVSGLYLFVRYAWSDIYAPSAYLKYESSMSRVITGYKAGIIQGSYNVFKQALQKNPLKFYYSNDWYHIYKDKMPLQWAGEILQQVPAPQKSRAFYWICYGTCANLAGRPELAMSAVKMLNEIAVKTTDAVVSTDLKNIAVIIRTSALVQRGLERQAYDKLFAYGKLLGEKGRLINYINHFATPALKDRKKFCIATGIDQLKLGMFGGLPKAQPFYDYESGKITSPQTGVPEPQLQINKSK